jgi:hypothetical protein
LAAYYRGETELRRARLANTKKATPINNNVEGSLTRAVI